MAPSQLPSMPKQATPKTTISSRLMTMKFMQRAAAAAATASDASSPATPQSDGGTAKRRKVAHTPSDAGSPATLLFDQQAIKAVLEEEEKKRQAAIEKRAAELGDSHWVLEETPALPKRSARPMLNVIQVSFAQIDKAASSGADDDDDPFVLGDVPAETRIRRSDNSDSDSDSDSEDGSDTPRSATDDRDQTDRGRQDAVANSGSKRPRTSLSLRREEERKRAQQFAIKRRKKEVKMNQPTSISAAGALGFQRSSTGISCHGCGKPGHKVAECPSRKR
ncbi:uncharacterized protein CTHT_0026410 [Thermochaetoides thermophila DSM 1495]|uniref:CCHC-type domain-containing protein n=1 Tax=Chaetomium thermophilum (strain DSM 1495 / CBS 144.50 / IMI 039719) TaxID=759272 RepID=G0S6J2_CHATD|nr:hypothetical protein CTHT_0026410 [Thermochaetoides thermophila DSM 1495]EGS20803.1 hypothetical protein CTHT_0026410 [Thermochaetoides thermophila DSM 1495]